LRTPKRLLCPQTGDRATMLSYHLR